MADFVPCLVPPSLPTEEGIGLSPSSVLLDTTAYISAAAVSNATTAVGELSTGAPIHISFCLARPPRLSYMCAHFPGPAAGTHAPAHTPAVRCIKEPPQVISTHADIALLRVPLPGALDLVTNHEHHDYFVYTARPRLGASTLERLPHPHPKGAAFQDNEVAIFRCSGGSTSRYVIAGLRNTIHSEEFKLQRYDSDTGVWTSTLLSVHAPTRDKVLPFPRTATRLLFHKTTKVITLGGPRVTIGWVDLWRGILHCNVLDEEPVLRDVPLPKPMKANRRSFCRGSPHRYREIAVVTLPGRQQIEIKYLEMETRPGEDVQSVDTSGSDDDLDVTPYWKATVWTMPVPVASWKDWHRDKECMVDVTDIVVDNPSHSELLLPLPRLRTDPISATMSLRRLLTAHPTLELDGDGDLVIYLLSKVDYMDHKGWVIAIGARDKKLRGIAELDSRKNGCFMRYYLHTEISKYLNNATALRIDHTRLQQQLEAEQGRLTEALREKKQLEDMVVKLTDAAAGVAKKLEVSEAEAAGARRTLVERETAHNTVVQAVEQVLGVEAGEALVARIGAVTGKIREKNLETARAVVRRVMAMFISHYSTMDREALSDGWAPGYTDEEYDQIEAESTEFSRTLADNALRELGLLE